MDCPYRHEHQHREEYSHDGGALPPPPKKGGSRLGSRLGGGGGTSGFGGGNVGGSAMHTRSATPTTRGMNCSGRDMARDAALARFSASAAASAAAAEVILVDSDDDDDGNGNDHNAGGGGGKKRKDPPGPTGAIRGDLFQGAEGGVGRKRMRGGTRPAAAAAASDAASDAVDLCGDSDSHDDDVEIVGTAVAAGDRRPVAGARSVPPVPAASVGLLSSISAVARRCVGQGGAMDEERRQIAQAVAASNRDILEQQDREYYEALVADREKVDRRQRKDRERLEKEDALKAEEEKERKRRDRMRDEAARALEPEPDSEPKLKPDGDTDGGAGQIATVAFRLPSSCQAARGRLERRFRYGSSVGQLFAYLRTRKELDGITWSLRSMVGGEIFVENSVQTVEDMGLVPRGVVVVKDELL